MKRTVLLLGVYSIAMALLEAVVVVYMRRLYYPENPLDLFPLAFLNLYDPMVELSREVATIVMIVVVALLAERRTLTRSFAAFVLVFGTWDLFYYVWLKVLIGWPRTVFEWDVLFLIPYVWLGPWICPAAIALLFAVWGSWGLLSQRDVEFRVPELTMFVMGAAMGLVCFMQPAIANGPETLSDYVPGDFWWWLFVPSYGLMAISLAMTGRPQRRSSRE